MLCGPGFNDTVLALFGDIRPGLYPVVDVPNNIFRLIATPVNVPTEATMQAAIEEVEDEPQPAISPLLGPYADRTAGTEAVRPRIIQLLPNQFAPLFLRSDGLPPIVAYRALHEALEEANALESCSDALTWLRAACTRRGGCRQSRRFPKCQSYCHSGAPTGLGL